MEANTPASIAAFRSKSAADKIVSYMWYVHVLVSVNAETRLRAKIAPVLEHSASSNFPGSASLEGIYVDQSGKPDRQEKQQSAYDLTDHLVLWLFNHKILARLVDTAPVVAQANSYARILADIPASFREEFCRRVYTLLFSKRIVEWPHGIDVPEPAIAATEPSDIFEVPVELEDTHLSPKYEQEDISGAGLDGVMKDKDEDFGPTASSTRPARSVFLQTPSLASWSGDDVSHMERATWFGTVSSPLPLNYFADWEWSRNGSSPRASVDEHNMSGEQPRVPFSSPQKQDNMGNEFLQMYSCNSNRDEPVPAPHAHQQSRKNPSLMYGDEIEEHGGEISRQSPGDTTGSGICRFGCGRMGTGHTAPKQPNVNDEQQGSEFCLGERLTGGRPL